MYCMRRGIDAKGLPAHSLSNSDEQTYAKKKTRRQIFLEKMAATFPVDSSLLLIQPVYDKPSGECQMSIM